MGERKPDTSSSTSTGGNESNQRVLNNTVPPGILEVHSLMSHWLLTWQLELHLLAAPRPDSAIVG